MKNPDSQDHVPDPEAQGPPAPPPAPPARFQEGDPLGRRLTKAEVAAVFGVSRRTVTNWLGRGCPSERESDGRRLFDEDEVRAWRLAQVAEDNEQDADAVPSPTAPAERATLAKAELVRKLTQARRQELELAAERGLKDLALANTIRGAKTHDDMLAVSTEVCALIGSGVLSPTRGRAIQLLLGEMRRSLKEHLGTGGDEEPERIVLLSEEGAALVEDYEAIVSDERRAKVCEYVARERAIDEEESPYVDLAALSPEEAEELGLDPDDLDTGEGL